MKSFFLLIVITTAFALVSPSDAHAACELVTSQYKCVAPGAVTDQCEFNSMTSEYYMYTRAADSQCIVDGNNCEATFGAGHFCAKLEAWSMDCGECSTGPQQEEKSCSASGGYCTPTANCEDDLTRPNNDWQEASCRIENGGTCCLLDQHMTTGCETAGDCHRDYIGCYYGELRHTKEWSRTFYSREEAQQWLDNFNINVTYSFDGTITLEDITFPIDGELERMIGYFPYGDPDGAGPSPDVIRGMQDLVAHNYVPGPLLKLAPPQEAAEIANWLPAMLKNYKQYAVRLDYCGNNRAPEDDDTAVDPNNPDVGLPEIRGAVRGPWGLKQSMYNTALGNGLWSWIARRPNQTEAEAINEAKNLAVSLNSGKSLGSDNSNRPLTATPEPAQKQTYYNLLTQAEDYQTLGNVLGKITCPEVNPCPGDRRGAPQYDEDCVWYNGKTVMTSTFEDRNVNKDNSDTRIDTRSVGTVDMYTAHISHWESIEMNADVRECNLAEYWPLKLHLFLNLIPPEKIASAKTEQTLTSSPENTWSKMDLSHSNPNIEVLVDDKKIGKEITYMELSGWAKTAEELVMGKRISDQTLGASTKENSNTGQVLAASTSMDTGLGYAIPPSWGGVYLPMIIKDYEGEAAPPGEYAPGPSSIPNPEALAAQVEEWADSHWGEGAGDRFIYLALTEGESGMGANCGTCIAWDEYKKHPALDTEGQRNALIELNKIWHNHDIRSNHSSFSSQYIPDTYAVQGIKGSCGGGALGLSQLLPGTAIMHLNSHGLGEPFDLWEPETAMKVMAAELHRLGWHKDLTWTQKLNVLRKWNNTDWWLKQILETAKEYMNYMNNH